MRWSVGYPHPTNGNQQSECIFGKIWSLLLMKKLENYNIMVGERTTKRVKTIKSIFGEWNNRWNENDLI